MKGELIFQSRTINLATLNENIERLPPHYIQVYLWDGGIYTDIDDYEVIKANDPLYSKNADNPNMLVLDLSDGDTAEVPLTKIKCITYYEAK